MILSFLDSGRCRTGTRSQSGRSETSCGDTCRTKSQSVDPFARNCNLASVTNDINPNSSAMFHMDAEAFLKHMREQGRMFDLGIVDPPYSPRQVSECYKEAGLKCGHTDTQNSVLYKRVRDAMSPLISDGGIVLSFGWSTTGMGESRGFKIIEILSVCHGGAHNDTICMAERRIT